jgi:hypothetical protein
MSIPSASSRWPVRALPRLLTVLGILAICLGSSSRSCSLNNSSGGGGGGDEPSFVTQLLVQDSAGQQTDSFQRDEIIQFTLTVRNRLNRAAEVDFPSARTFDFVVVRENTDDVVWKWSEDQAAFNEVQTTLQFDAGETLSFQATWNQIGRSGSRVRADRYEARGVLVYDGFDSNPLRTNQLGSTLQRFTIN